MGMRFQATLRASVLYAAILAWSAVVGEFAWAQGAPGEQKNSDGSAAIEIFAPPDFVVEHEPVLPRDSKYPATLGLRLLLLDTQHDATGEEAAVYMRQVVEAEGYAGVAAASQLAVAFDPAYQRFEVNHVRVIRGGAGESRRDRAQLDFLRREEALEQHQVTGLLTASLRLDDIRVGDVVDIAYTIYGAQPAFGGLGARTFMLAHPLPVERTVLRSRWPAGARWAVHGDGPHVEETVTNGSVLLEIQPQPVDAFELEEFTPAWEPMIPYLEVTGFEDWAALADWGRALFRATPDPEVKAIAESIAAEHHDKAEQVVAALRFVQQEVRYLAITFGAGGYVPAAPGETLRTRTGECKAKTLLFLALMDALDVEAAAALVNTLAGPTLPDRVPSPTAFDHVIARVTLDGKAYWLDPTSLFQGGKLDTLAQAWFGYALPLERQSDGPVAMTRQDLAAPDVVIRETYDLSEGPSQPARVRLEITSRYGAADNQRAMFAMYARSDIDDGVIERYKDRYGEAFLAEESRYADDLHANVFTSIYEVTLDEPFRTRSGDPGRRWFKVKAFTIKTPVPASTGKKRAWPVRVAGPSHQRHEIALKLPEIVGGWDLPPADDAIENDAFRFHRGGALSGLTYTLTFELETLSDAIEPDSVDAILEDQERMLDLRTKSIWINADVRAPLPDLKFPQVEIDVAPQRP